MWNLAVVAGWELLGCGRACVLCMLINMRMKLLVSFGRSQDYKQV
jgi:hypothetical protein